MNITQIVIAQAISIISLLTLSGVLLHDTHLDKVFSVSQNQLVKDQTSEIQTRVRLGSSLHPHTEHLSVHKDQSDTATLPKRDRRRLAHHRRQTKGFHGDNVCLPLAGEWS